MIHPDLSVRKIISGGQTGADWAALDWAIHHGVPHGGWCPLGRKAENGTIDPRFQLEETPSTAYPVRTRWNVRDADATLIFTLAAELAGGSLLTRQMADQLDKPCLAVSAATSVSPAEEVRDFVETYHVETLNVAGPRESTEPNIGLFVTRVLDEALLPENRP